MLLTKLTTVAALLFIGTSPVEVVAREVIKFAAIDWCPQLCDKQTQQGYIIELVEQIYPDSEFQRVIEFFPWSRAIKVVRSGQYHALLSPAKYEAPDLLYPVHPAGFQQMCFFSLKENAWQYTGVSSLQGISIGMAADTSIAVLNDYFAAHPAQFQLQPYLDRYVEQNANKLLKRRIDTFIFTRNSTLLELSRLGLHSTITLAGCVERERVYVAFSAHAAIQSQVAGFITRYDTQYPGLVDSGWVQALYDKYSVSWSDGGTNDRL